MKMRPLPETDLAEICSLPLESRRKRLEGINISHAPYSYAAARRNLPDLLNEQPPMLAPQPPTNWEHIERAILKSSKPGKEAAANLSVARSLHQFTTANLVVGRRIGMSPMGLGFGISVSFWAPSGILIDGGLVVPFMDFRRKGLSVNGRRIVLSLMQEHIETRYPDLIDARLAVIQFADTQGREISVHYADRSSLLAFDELQTRIEETYALWFEVLVSRDKEARKAGGGGSLL